MTTRAERSGALTARPATSCTPRERPSGAATARSTTSQRRDTKTSKAAPGVILYSRRPVTVGAIPRTGLFDIDPELLSKMPLSARARLGKNDGQGIARPHVVEKLSEDTFRPLVDLAASSRFVESQKDVAAALTALAQSETNKKVLAKAGVVSAVLTLTTSASPDVQSDAWESLAVMAADASGCRKFIDEKGLPRAFERVRLSRAPVKRAISACLVAVCSNEEVTIDTLGADGWQCLRYLAHLPDAKARKNAAICLRSIATTDEHYQWDVERLDLLVDLLSHTDAAVVKLILRAVLRVILSGVYNRTKMWEAGVLRPLATLLVSADDTLCLCSIKCLASLASIGKHGENLAREGVLPSLAQFLHKVHVNRSPLLPSEVELQRLGARCSLDLLKHGATAAPMIDAGVVIPLQTLALSADTATRHTCAKAISLLAFDTTVRGRFLNHCHASRLIDSMHSTDYVVRSEAATTVRYLTTADQNRPRLVLAGFLPRVKELCNTEDEHLVCNGIIILAETLDHVSLRCRMNDDSMVKTVMNLAHQKKFLSKGKQETVTASVCRILCAMSEDALAANALVRNGGVRSLVALRHISHQWVSRVNTALHNLRHEMAALKIQTIYRTHHAKTKFRSRLKAKEAQPKRLPPIATSLTTSDDNAWSWDVASSLVDHIAVRDDEDGSEEYEEESYSN